MTQQAEGQFNGAATAASAAASAAAAANAAAATTNAANAAKRADAERAAAAEREHTLDKVIANPSQANIDRAIANGTIHSRLASYVKDAVEQLHLKPSQMSSPVTSEARHAFQAILGLKAHELAMSAKTQEEAVNLGIDEDLVRYLPNAQRAVNITPGQEAEDSKAIAAFNMLKEFKQVHDQDAIKASRADNRNDSGFGGLAGVLVGGVLGSVAAGLTLRKRSKDKSPGTGMY